MALSLIYSYNLIFNVKKDQLIGNVVLNQGAFHMLQICSGRTKYSLTKQLTS